MKFAWLPFLALAVAAPAQQPGTIEVHSQEWVDVPERHLSIRGTLNGHTPFIVMLPPRETWKGRIIQWLSGGFGGRMTGDRGQSGYALANGAAFVESTQGHDGPPFYKNEDTLTELAYEASYTVMQYAKARCVEIYGKEPRFSYVFGSSGGAVRGTGLIERFPKVYDGAVTTVGGGTFKLHWFYGSLFDYYQKILEPKADAMSEAVGPNGKGDPFSVLTTREEKEALRMVLTAGLSKSLVGLLSNRFGFQAMSATKHKFDPGFFDDFWSFGYVEQEVKPLVVEVEGSIKAADAANRTIVVDLPEAPSDLTNYMITFTSGKLAGQWRHVRRNEGRELVIVNGGPGVEGLAAGDRFRLDNRDQLAWLDYYRHIADADEPAARELYRNGKPLYTQRSHEAMRFLDETDRQVGKISGKLITIFATEDPWARPVLADRYHRGVRKHLGAAAEDQYRIYFVERSPHGGSRENLGPRQISKLGLIYKAQDEMIAWVEKGQAPAPSTSYRIDSMNQLVLPETAAERKGYQLVVRLRANGREERIEVRVGEEIRFEAEAEDPDNGLLEAEIDFDGDDRFDQTVVLSGQTAVARFKHRFREPGTYISAVRVTDTTESFGGGIQNLAAIRVVVR